MSKTILHDDDIIEILDFIYRHFDDIEADYLFDKLCMMSGRDGKEYYKLLEGLAIDKTLGL